MWPGPRYRVYWEQNYDEVSVGDSMYWSRPNIGLVHMSVVSKKTSSDPYGIYYAQHNSPYASTYKPLWQGMQHGYDHVGFAWLIW